MRSLYILVVLYGKRLSECSSVATLLPWAREVRETGVEVQLVVWNNSPPGFAVGEAEGILLMGDGENRTLPEVYNAVARLAAARSPRFLLMLADDDSDFSGFSAGTLAPYLREGEAREYALLLPRVHSGGELVSPARRIWCKGVRLASIEPGKVAARNLVAINSGMVVFSECIARMPHFFNPRLRYYGTDTDFMVRYQKLYSHAMVLPEEVGHSLSEHGGEPLERALFRWKDHCYALGITFGTNPLAGAAVACYVLYLRVKQAVRFRSLRFLA